MDYGTTIISSRSGNGYVKIEYDTYSTKESSDLSINIKDKAAPNKPSNGELIGEANLIRWQDNGDNGSTYYHMVESYNSDNGAKLHTSNITEDYIIAGVKGWYYYIDNNANGTVTKENSKFTEVNYTNIERSQQKQYIHIATVDGAENLSQTYNYEIIPVSNYTVNHYLMKEDGVTYYLQDSNVYTEIIGTNIIAETNNYPGFTSPQKKSGIVLADNKLVIDYQYTRNQSTLKVNPNEGVWNGSTQEQNFTQRYNTVKNIPNPTRVGYTFNGWQRTNNYGNLVSVTDGWKYTFGESNNVTDIITAKWELITKNITGTVIWNDENDKYGIRPQNVTVTLDRTPETGTVTQLPNPATVNKPSSGNQAQYTFSNVQSIDTTTGREYTYSVSQNEAIGYETKVSGFNITNTLILPTYTSSIQYAPVDSLDGAYLKNGKVKVTAQAKANENNRDKVGLNEGTVTFNIDQDILIDAQSIKIVYTNGETGEKTTITNYSCQNNQIVVKFGKDNNGISEKKDTITIEVQGTLNKIGTYTSNINVTGKLRTYKGVNTDASLGTVTQASQQITVQYQMPNAKISITKTDSITEGKLTDAEFTLYEWNGSNYIEKERITDVNGDGIYESKYYEWDKTTDGKYKVVETKVPENHKDLKFSMEYRIDQLKTENYTITPDYNNNKYKIAYGIRHPDDFDNKNGTVENEPYKLKAQIEKIDSETKKQIVVDTQYTIYEWNNENQTYEIYMSHTSGQEVKMQRQEDGTYLSTEWLYYTAKNEGKYRIIETKAPSGYYGDYLEGETKQKRNYDINILEIIRDSNYKGQNVSNESTLKVGNNGEKLENQRVKNKIEVTKIDSQSKQTTPQGDAKIEGTIYGLYAREKIHHADGVTATKGDETALLYRQGELVQTQTINAEGKLTFSDLECGKYYIKEIEAGEGYLIDETEYDVDLTYRNEENILITEERTLEETVKKQGIKITKLVQKEDDEYQTISKVGFTIYDINKLSIVKEGKIKRVTRDRYQLLDEEALQDPILKIKEQSEGIYRLVDLVDYYYKINYTHEGFEQNLPNDGIVYNPYDMEDEPLIMNYEESREGVPIEEIRLNEEGQLISPKLAYGEYIVLETSVPLNYDAATPFLVNIEIDSEEPQSMRYIVDPNFETRIKIYKQDSETKQNVIGKTAKYVIRNLDTNELVINKTWTVDGYIQQGTYETPYELGKEGFLITQTKLGIGNYEIEEVEAPYGYVLNGYEGSSNNGETISTPKTKIQFEIKGNTAYYVDERIEDIVIVQKNENEAQVGTIKIETVGEYLKQVTTEENGTVSTTYEEAVVSGAKYQIIAKEDIISQDNQTTLYTAGEVIQTVTSNSEGIAYAENLPIGTYIVKQIVAGEGFAHNAEEKEITISYEQGENGEEAQKTPVIYKTTKFTNERQRLDIEIEKQDVNTQTVLPGAIFGIYSKENILGKDGTTVIRENRLVEKVTTNENGIAKFNNEIPLGEYYIKELKAPEGYILREDQIQIDGNYQTDEREIYSIKEIYTNTKTSINVEKVNIEEQLISQAVLQIQDQQGTVVHEWETEENPQEIEGLEYDKDYKLVEKTPAPGYVTSEKIVFRLNDKGNIVGNNENTITMVDERTKIQIDVVDKETKEKLEGMKFEIIKETKDEEGNVVEEVVGEFTTGEEGYYIEGLPIGDYVLRQEKITNEEFIEKGYVTMDRVEITIKDVNEVQEIVIEQEVDEISIEKTNIEGEAISNAVLNLQDENGEIIEEWTTTNEAHTIKGIEYNKTYNLVEKTPAPGYVTAQPINFRLGDEGKIEGNEENKITMVDELTKIQIGIVDKQTREQIEGMEFEIIKQTKDEEGNIEEEVVREFTTEEESYYTEGLPIGEYILRQKEITDEELIKKGYVTMHEMKFTVDDVNKVQEIILEQELSKIKLKLVDEQTERDIEDLVDLEIVVKDEEGNIVRDVKGEDIKNIIEGLPQGKYTVEVLNPPHGYEAKTTTIEVKDSEDVQEMTIKLKRAEFDLKIEHWIQKIERNGQVEYESTQPKDQALKIEVSSKNIKTDDIRITYRVQVSNPSKVAGKVTRLEMNIPGCMRFYPQDNTQYCQEKNGKVIMQTIEQIELKENESVYMDVVLRWKNEQEAFGLNKTIAEIKETDNKLHFEESNLENNRSEAEIVIGIKTGMIVSVIIIVIVVVSLGICGYVIVKIIKNRKNEPNINKIKFLNR